MSTCQRQKVLDKSEPSSLNQWPRFITLLITLVSRGLGSSHRGLMKNRAKWNMWFLFFNHSGWLQEWGHRWCMAVISPCHNVWIYIYRYRESQRAQFLRTVLKLTILRIIHFEGVNGWFFPWNLVEMISSLYEPLPIYISNLKVRNSDLVHNICEGFFTS